MDQIKTIDVSELKKIATGLECTVYDFGNNQVIKCFRSNSKVRKDSMTSVQDVWLAHKKLAEENLANPVGEFVRWLKKEKTQTISGEGYICTKVKVYRKYSNELEARMHKKLTQQGYHLIDVHSLNIGKYKNELVMIDVGYDAARILNK